MAMGINTFQIAVAMLAFTTVMGIMAAMGILTGSTGVYTDQYSGNDSTIQQVDDPGSAQGNSLSIGDFFSFAWPLQLIGGIISFFTNAVYFAVMLSNVFHVPPAIGIPLQAATVVIFSIELYPLIVKINPF